MNRASQVTSRPSQVQERLIGALIPDALGIQNETTTLPLPTLPTLSRLDTIEPATLLEGEDLRPVPMTAYRTRSGKPTTTFYPSKQLAQNDLGMLLGFFGPAVLAIGSPIAVWPRRRKSLDGVPLNT